MNKARTWIDFTLERLQGLREKRARLESKAGELQADMDRLDARIQVLQDEIVEIRTDFEAELARTESSPVLKLGDTKYKSNLEMYGFLAEQNGGLLVCKEAVSAIRLAGLATKRSSALATMHSMLRRATERPGSGWAKAGKGKYRLTKTTNGSGNKVSMPSVLERVARDAQRAMESARPSLTALEQAATRVAAIPPLFLRQ